MSRVNAYVDLETEEHKRAIVESFRNSQWAEDPEALKKIEEGVLDATKYQMNVSLAAQMSDGRRISTGGSDFSFGGPKRGLAAIWRRYRGPRLSDDPLEHERLLEESYRVGLPDVEDAINQMLGRDPDQHRPPRLSWEKLLAALADEGIQVSEQELSALPFVIELSPEAKTELGLDEDPPGA